MRKKLNNLPETSSDETSDDNNNSNDNDDSEYNQISNFVDRVLKKVSKEIVNDDNKNDDGNADIKKVSKGIVNDDNKNDNKNDDGNADVKKKSNQKSKENITENLFNKQVRDLKNFFKLVEKKGKFNAESIAKTDKEIEEIKAKNKAKEEVSKNTDKVLKKYYTNEAQKASKEIKKFNKMINDNLDMSSEKSEIINKLIELYSLIQINYLNKIDNNLETNENIDNISIGSDIRKLEKRLRDLPKKGRGRVYFAKRVCKIVNFFSTITS